MVAARHRVKICQACGYYSPSRPHAPGKCLRFARFVEHVINDYTKDCEYWSPKEEKHPRKGGPKPP
ncbi:MAG TPA: hypothetical protein PLR20_09935 [Syntrophales bacterium]|jgi:hypothetical protein|nr:hypothetical protein [Syntrophales bacterium]HOX93199.1 hypothetical protein [Syntrophales bacterium]HPI57623.1 hypothetical protein [Syntrophales bacterium]HPN25364.1 hypothetical protein [Syntrophales bacterium]HQM29656.1 hypothetical protein [Syntrophales bacterium]